MIALQLLSELRERGVRLEARGEKLRFYPPAAVDHDLLDRLKRHKRDVLALLAREREQPQIPASQPRTDPVQEREDGFVVTARATSFDLCSAMVDRLNSACPPDCTLSESDWAELDPLENRIAQAQADGDEVSIALTLGEYERVALELIEQRKQDTR